MIERETGYDATATCECKKCARCDGEGTLAVRYTQDARGRNVELTQERWFPCEDCNGTGLDSSDCAIDHSKEVKQ